MSNQAKSTTTTNSRTTKRRKSNDDSKNESEEDHVWLTSALPDEAPVPPPVDNNNNVTQQTTGQDIHDDDDDNNDDDDHDFDSSNIPSSSYSWLESSDLSCKTSLESIRKSLWQATQRYTLHQHHRSLIDQQQARQQQQLARQQQIINKADNDDDEDGMLEDDHSNQIMVSCEIGRCVQFSSDQDAWLIRHRPFDGGVATNLMSPVGKSMINGGSGTSSISSPKPQRRVYGRTSAIKSTTTTTTTNMASTTKTVPIARLHFRKMQKAPSNNHQQQQQLPSLAPPRSLLQFIWATAELHTILQRARQQVEQARLRREQQQQQGLEQQQQPVFSWEDENEQHALLVPTRDGKEINLEPLLQSVGTFLLVANGCNHASANELTVDKALAILEQALDCIHDVAVLVQVFRRPSWKSWRVVREVVGHDQTQRPPMYSSAVERWVWACLVPPSLAARSSCAQQQVPEEQDALVELTVTPVTTTTTAAATTATSCGMEYNATLTTPSPAILTVAAITTTPRRRLVLTSDNDEESAHEIDEPKVTLEPNPVVEDTLPPTARGSSKNKKRKSLETNSLVTSSLNLAAEDTLPPATRSKKRTSLKAHAALDHIENSLVAARPRSPAEEGSLSVPPVALGVSKKRKSLKTNSLDNVENSVITTRSRKRKMTGIESTATAAAPLQPAEVVATTSSARREAVDPAELIKIVLGRPLPPPSPQQGTTTMMTVTQESTITQDDNNISSEEQAEVMQQEQATETIPNDIGLSGVSVTSTSHSSKPMKPQHEEEREREQDTEIVPKDRIPSDDYMPTSSPLSHESPQQQARESLPTVPTRSDASMADTEHFAAQVVILPERCYEALPNDSALSDVATVKGAPSSVQLQHQEWGMQQEQATATILHDHTVHDDSEAVGAPSSPATIPQDLSLSDVSTAPTPAQLGQQRREDGLEEQQQSTETVPNDDALSEFSVSKTALLPTHVEQVMDELQQELPIEAVLIDSKESGVWNEKAAPSTSSEEVALPPEQASKPAPDDRGLRDITMTKSPPSPSQLQDANMIQLEQTDELSRIHITLSDTAGAASQPIQHGSDTATLSTTNAIVNTRNNDSGKYPQSNSAREHDGYDKEPSENIASFNEPGNDQSVYPLHRMSEKTQNYTFDATHPSKKGPLNGHGNSSTTRCDEDVGTAVTNSPEDFIMIDSPLATLNVRGKVDQDDGVANATIAEGWSHTLEENVLKATSSCPDGVDATSKGVLDEVALDNSEALKLGGKSTCSHFEDQDDATTTVVTNGSEEGSTFPIASLGVEASPSRAPDFSGKRSDEKDHMVTYNDSSEIPIPVLTHNDATDPGTSDLGGYNDDEAAEFFAMMADDETDFLETASPGVSASEGADSADVENAADTSNMLAFKTLRATSDNTCSPDTTILTPPFSLPAHSGENLESHQMAYSHLNPSSTQSTQVGRSNGGNDAIDIFPIARDDDARGEPTRTTDATCGTAVQAAGTSQHSGQDGQRSRRPRRPKPLPKEWQEYKSLPSKVRDFTVSAVEVLPMNRNSATKPFATHPTVVITNPGMESNHDVDANERIGASETTASELEHPRIQLDSGDHTLESGQHESEVDSAVCHPELKGEQSSSLKDNCVDASASVSSERQGTESYNQTPADDVVACSQESLDSQGAAGVETSLLGKHVAGTPSNNDFRKVDESINTSQPSRRGRKKSSNNTTKSVLEIYALQSPSSKLHPESPTLDKQAATSTEIHSSKDTSNKVDNANRKKKSIDAVLDPYSFELEKGPDQPSGAIAGADLDSLDEHSAKIPTVQQSKLKKAPANASSGIGETAADSVQEAVSSRLRERKSTDAMKSPYAEDDSDSEPIYYSIIKRFKTARQSKASLEPLEPVEYADAVGRKRSGTKVQRSQDTKRQSMRVDASAPSRGKGAAKRAIDDCDWEQADGNTSRPSAGTTQAKDLDYRVIVSDYLYRFQTALPVAFGSSLSDAQQAIADTLATHDKEGNVIADEEYNEEVRLQKQSFRTLKQRADQERLESIRFAEAARLRQREFEYYKRKDAADEHKAEFDRLCNQPIRFVSNEEWEEAKKMKCCFGEGCLLCSNVGSRPLEVFNPESKPFLPAPLVKPSKVNDLWDSSRDEPAESDSRSRRSRRNGGKMKQALLMLIEMQHTLSFIEENNKRARMWKH